MVKEKEKSEGKHVSNRGVNIVKVKYNLFIFNFINITKLFPFM